MTSEVRIIFFALAVFISGIRSHIFHPGRREFSIYSLISFVGILVIVFSGQTIQLALIGFTFVLLSVALEFKDRSSR